MKSSLKKGRGKKESGKINATGGISIRFFFFFFLITRAGQGQATTVHQGNGVI